MIDIEKSKAICEAEEHELRNELWVIAVTAQGTGPGAVQAFDAVCDRYVAWAKANALTEIEANREIERLREALEECRSNFRSLDKVDQSPHWEHLITMIDAALGGKD